MMDYLVKPKSPCTKDCPYRDTYCRVDCEDYRDYEEKYRQYHDSKRKKAEREGEIFLYIKNLDTKFKKRKTRHG